MNKTSMPTIERVNPTLQKVFITAYASIFLAQFGLSVWHLLSQTTPSFDSRISIQTLTFFLIPIGYFCMTYLIHPGRILLQRVFESLVLTVIIQMVGSLLQQILLTANFSWASRAYGRWTWGIEALVAVLYFFTICYIRFVTKTWK